MGEASRAFCYSHSSGLVATLHLLSPQHHHLGWKTLLLSSVRFNASFTETKTFDTTPILWHLMCLLQVPEGVPSGPVPSVLAAQVSAAPAFHLLQLALSGKNCQSTATHASPSSFQNQKRRRPVRRRDQTFNYSADIYCEKYDETTGLCPHGDE